MSDMICNYLVHERTRLIRGMILSLLVTTLVACGPLDEAQHTVNTVDDAVTLLQDLDQYGTWKTISDGLDALADQRQGYAARVQLREGTVDITLDIQSDPEGNALVKVTKGDQITTYLVEGYRSPSDDTRIYRLDNEQYACEQDALLRGLGGLFDQYALRAAGAQLLSVADKKDEDARVADRDATHYELESKVPDALKILKQIDNEELRQKIEQAGQFTLTGSLDLDQSSGALLRFESTYVDQSRTDFSFEVTQWGKIATLPTPTPDQITLACP